jgi:hypothetical protein
MQQTLIVIGLSTYLLSPGGYLIRQGLLPMDDRFTHALLVGVSFYAYDQFARQWLDAISQ